MLKYRHHLIYRRFAVTNVIYACYFLSIEKKYNVNAQFYYRSTLIISDPNSYESLRVLFQNEE